MGIDHEDIWGHLAHEIVLQYTIAHIYRTDIGCYNVTSALCLSLPYCFREKHKPWLKCHMPPEATLKPKDGFSPISATYLPPNALKAA